VLFEMSGKVASGSSNSVRKRSSHSASSLKSEFSLCFLIDSAVWLIPTSSRMDLKTDFSLFAFTDNGLCSWRKLFFLELFWSNYSRILFRWRISCRL